MSETRKLRLLPLLMYEGAKLIFACQACLMIATRRFTRRLPAKRSMLRR
ncbi:hypothetical protein SAMN03159488_01500 [Pseudomonas sp. NFIX10]|nr:hypothetical protein SAMN03159488_01500 [Pseudomonas sp. NFIX10]SFE56879.1 hypothetical protein SAMN03159367_01500 [Pseudomonas sp. NFACC06-1]